ncbi:uncharacterized protein LOC142960603 [Anarhichas minor]|uniref:uncharacterized protein LOC142960603 n=1 Tax=Anarhichas minor TaxID=65739 RepID=UPI003F73E794
MLIVASVPSASTQNTTQLSSSTGSYTPSSASTQTTTQLSSSTGSYTPSSASPEGVLLYVRLTLVIMIIVLSTAVLIICRKSEPKAALRGRNTGLINAEIIRTGTEGGNIRVGCTFTFSARKKIFCKEPCEEGDILIETEDVTAQRGRYSITYTEGAYPVRSTVLYVSITKLTKSDAGKYRCGLHRSLPLPSSYQDIEIRVEEAPISSKPNVTLKPLSASVPSASTQNTTQLSSSTGSYTPSSASPEGTQQSQKEQTPAAGVLLYVRLTLVIMIIVLSTAVLIICRKSEPKEPTVEAVYANITEANRVSEEIREEDEESRTPPLEMSAV